MTQLQGGRPLMSADMFGGTRYGFLKVWIRAFFVHGFREMNGFLSVFHGEFRIIRAIRVQKLIPSSDNEKAIAACTQNMSGGVPSHPLRRER